MTKAKIMRRVCSVVLSTAILGTSMPISDLVISAENSEDEKIREQLSSLISEEDYPHGLFQFLSPRIETSEEVDYVEFAVVRAGNTDGNASVKFKASDVSAIYGKDYYVTVPTFWGEDELEADSDQSMIEETAEKAEQTPILLQEQNDEAVFSEETGSEEQGTEENEDAAAAEEQAPAPEDPDKADSQEQKEVVLEKNDDAPKDLESAVAMKTGGEADYSTWRDRDEEISKEELINAHNDKYKELPGAEYTLEFESGEYMKKLRFYVVDDDLAEDDELAMLVLSDAEGAALSENPTGLVNIKDNDEYTVSKFCIDEDKVVVSPDETTATITVRRTVGNDHMGEVDVKTAEGTAQSGINYEGVSATLSFQSGQEYQKVEIPIKNRSADESLHFSVWAGTDDTVDIEIMPGSDISSQLIGESEELTASVPYNTEKVSVNANEADAAWTARPAGGDLCGGGSWNFYIYNDSPSSKSWRTTSNLDLSMVGRLTFDVYNGSRGTYWKKKFLGFLWKTSEGYYKDFVTYAKIGDSKVFTQRGSFNKKTESYKLNDEDRKQQSITVGNYTLGDTKDTDATFRNIQMYYLPINVQLETQNYAAGKADHDSWLYTRTYTGVNKYTENEKQKEAKFIGDLKFGDGSSETKKYFYNDDTVSLKPDFENSDLSEEEQENIYLWGFKIESKDLKNIGYYYVEGDSFKISDLYKGNLRGYRINSSGKKEYATINVGNIKLSDSSIGDKDIPVFRLYPVYRQKQAYVMMSIDSEKSDFSAGTFKKDQCLAVGMLDTVKYDIKCSKSNTVKSYSLYAQTTDGLQMTSDQIERRIYNEIYHQTDETQDLKEGLSKIKDGSPFDIESRTIKDSSWSVRELYVPTNLVKSEFSVKPSELTSGRCNEIHLVANYDEASITMEINPSCTYIDGAKNVEVQYEDQTARYEGVLPDKSMYGSKISIRPMELAKLYKFSSVITDPNKYQIKWQDLTGDVNHDGEIDAKELRALKDYHKSNPSGMYSGDAFQYTPADQMVSRQLYYNVVARTPNQTGKEGTISGTVKIRKRTVLENTEGKSGSVVPLEGAQVVVAGRTLYTDEKGNFSVKSKDFMIGDSYGVTINSSGRIYNAAVTVGKDAGDIILEDYTTFNISDFKAYEVTNKSGYENVKKWEYDEKTPIEISNADKKYKFSFKVKALSTQEPGKAEVSRYSSDGTLKRTYEAEYIDGEYIVNPTVLEGTDKNKKYYSFNPASEGVQPGDYFTIRMHDKEGLIYPDHEVGIKFSKALSVIKLVNSFKAPYNGVIEFIGKADAYYDLGFVTSTDEGDSKLDRKFNSLVTISTTEDEETGTLTKTISAGWDKNWKKKKDDKDKKGKDAADEAKEMAQKSEESSKTDSEESSKTDSEESSKTDSEESSKTDSEESSKTDSEESSKTDSEESPKTEKANELMDKDNKNKNKSKITNDWSVDLKIAYRLTMKQDDPAEGWYFEDFVVVATLASKVSVKYSYTLPIGVTIFVTAGLGGDIVATMGAERYRNNYQYFDGNGGIDLTTIGMDDVNRKLTFYGQLDVNPYVTLSAGAGIGKIANVELKGKAQFNMSFRAAGNGAGKVKLSGELVLDLIGGLVEKKWNLGQYQHDLFSYNDGSVSKSPNIRLFSDDEDFRYDTVTVDDITDRAYLEGQTDNFGKKQSMLRSAIGAVSDLKNGLNLGAEMRNTNTLKTNVYPEAYPILETIKEGSGYDDDSQQILFWLDDDGSQDAYNRAQLMYSIYKNGVWSKPLKVDNDNTMDQTPVAYKMGDDCILVLWASADKKLTKDMDAAEMMNSYNIKARFFDCDTYKMSDVSLVTKTTEYDNFSDYDPNFAYTTKDGKEYLIVNYSKSNYKATGDDGEVLVGDMLDPNSYIGWRVYDFETNTWDDTWDINIFEDLDQEVLDNYNKYWYGQNFASLSSYAVVNDKDFVDEYGRWTRKPDKSDISIVEQDAPHILECESIGYDGKAVFAYVADGDRNKETLGDKDIYIQVYDFIQNKQYMPIRLTDDSLEESYIELMETPHGITLYYLSNGNIKELDITQLITEGLVMTTEDGNDVWLFDRSSQNFTGDKTIYTAEENFPISEYIAISDRSNSYLVWLESKTNCRDGIDPSSEEANKPENHFQETQLYMMMESPSDEESVLYDINGEICTYPEKDEDGNTIDYSTVKDVNGYTGKVKAGDPIVVKSAKYEWSGAVALTDEQGANFTDIDFENSANGVIRCVYLKGMSELMDYDGTEIAAENKDKRSLMCSDFDLNVTSYAIEFTDLSNIRASADNTPVNVLVRNCSLLSRENVTVELYADSTLVDSVVLDEIGGGEEKEVTLFWDTPENVQGVLLTANVKEAGEVYAETSETVEYHNSWMVNDVTTELIDRKTAEITATVENTGSQPSKDLVLYAYDDDRNIAESEKFDLEIGETKQISFRVPVDNDSFVLKRRGDGSIEEEMTITIEGPDNNFDAVILRTADKNQVSDWVAIKKIVLKDEKTSEEIGNSISMKVDDVRSLTWDAIDRSNETVDSAVTVLLESSDEDVVSVIDGKLVANKNGTATITVTEAPNCIVQKMLGNGCAYNRNTLATLPACFIKTEEITVTVSDTGALLGDANLDGTVNVRDCALIALKLAKNKVSELPENADYNQDKVINVRDAAAIARHLATRKK